MTSPIDFYFDFASPYAFFAAAPLEKLAARAGREVIWRPVLLWAVLKEIGMPPPMENEAKGRYLRHDILRSARFFGHDDFKMPEKFPLSTHLPARAFYALTAEDPELARRFARNVFKAYFTETANLGDPQTILALGAALNIPQDRMQEAMNTKPALIEANAEAVTRGVWGSPYMVADGEAFFGADRLPQLEAKLLP